MTTLTNIKASIRNLIFVGRVIAADFSIQVDGWFDAG
jgi:hypothetical protein